MPFDSTTQVEARRDTEVERIRAKLVEARALLARPGGWTQTAIARNARNRQVSVDAPDAVAFCVVGAVRRVTCSVDAVRVLLLRTLNASQGSWEGIAYWNDQPGRTQDEVVALFDRAIEQCGSP